jgi:hypothetical protein
MLIYPNTLTSVFKIGKWTSNDDAVALGFTGDAIAIWEMNTRSGVYITLTMFFPDLPIKCEWKM